MQQFSAVDWIIVIVLGIAGVSGLRKGFILSLFGLLGLVASLVVASACYESVAEMLQPLLHSGFAAEVTGFLLLLVGVSVAMMFLGKSLRGVFHAVGLGWADHLLGLVFGLLRGSFFLTIFVVILAAFWPGSTILKESVLAQVFLTSARAAEILTPDAMTRRMQEGIRELEKTRNDFFHLQTKFPKTCQETVG